MERLTPAVVLPKSLFILLDVFLEILISDFDQTPAELCDQRTDVRGALHAASSSDSPAHG